MTHRPTKRRLQRSIQLTAPQWKWIDAQARQLRLETGAGVSAGTVLRNLVEKAMADAR